MTRTGSSLVLNQLQCEAVLSYLSPCYGELGSPRLRVLSFWCPGGARLLSLSPVDKTGLRR